jgi:hypothetical protein
MEKSAQFASGNGEQASVRRDARKGPIVTTTWQWMKSLFETGDAKQPTRRARRTSRFVPSMLVLERRDTPTVTIRGGFEGINAVDPNAGPAPPNADVAVGPTVIIETTDLVATMRAKDGTVISTIDFATMFPVATANAFQAFPNVLYDDNAQRFYITVLEEDDTALTSFLHIAVSNTSTPTNFTTDFTESGTVDMFQITAVGLFVSDFVRIGYNADGVFVTSNQANLLTGLLDHTTLVTFRKSTLLDADNTTFRFFATDLTSLEYTLIPACMHQAPAGAPMLFFGTIAQAALLPGGSSNALQYRVMTNYFTANPTFKVTPVAVPFFNNGPTPNAFQPFSGVQPITLITFDASMLEAAWRNGRLVATQNANINGTTKVRWYELDAPANGTNPRLIQTGNIDPGPGISTYMPAIDIAQNLDIGISYLQSSADEFLSMYVTGRTQSDPKGTMQTPVRARGGDAIYVSQFPFTGFSGGIAVDPLNPNTFVAAQEYASLTTTTDNWGTFVSTFTVSPPMPSPLKLLNPLRYTFDRATGTYNGTLTITNTTATITGNLTLTLTVPDASIQVVNPAGTRVGNTITLPVTGPFIKDQPIRIGLQLLNPLKLPLGSIQIGVITSIS